MTTTYTGDPTASPKDEVRFLSEDVGPKEWFLSDEEIAYLLGKAGGNAFPYTAAAMAAWQTWLKMSTQADKRVGDVQKIASRRAEHFKDLYRELVERAKAVEGTSIFEPVPDLSDVLIDTDARDANPYFVSGQMDNPWAGGYVIWDPDHPGLASGSR